jgi:hypothetical protein
MCGRQGEVNVPAYRHYRLDGAGAIKSADWIDASDDSDAVRQVRELKLSAVSEIWDRNRLVGRVEPAPGDSSGPADRP